MAREKEKRYKMDNNYTKPTLEVTEPRNEDIISTSLSIELPWLPLEDDGKEI